MQKPTEVISTINDVVNKLNEIIDWINKMDAAILQGSGKEDPEIHPPLKISKREKMMKNNPVV